MLLRRSGVAAGAGTSVGLVACFHKIIPRSASTLPYAIEATTTASTPGEREPEAAEFAQTGKRTSAEERYRRRNPHRDPAHDFDARFLIKEQLAQPCFSPGCCKMLLGWLRAGRRLVDAGRPTPGWSPWGSPLADQPLRRRHPTTAALRGDANLHCKLVISLSLKQSESHTCALSFAVAAWPSSPRAPRCGSRW